MRVRSPWKETRTTLFTLVFPAPKGFLVNRLESTIYFLKMSEAGLLPNLPLK